MLELIINKYGIFLKLSLTSVTIKEQALSLGFHKVGIASINAQAWDSSIEHLQEWLEMGYHANMAWMANPKRFNLLECVPKAKSIICVAVNYYTNYRHSSKKEDGKISRYGWGRDYHKVLHKRLKALTHWIKAQCDPKDDIITKYYADTGPIQDKVWAQRSGIGWIAKNGNLITREYGSWVFLGEIVTNLILTPDTPHQQHCGTCIRCLDACPTNAITKPFVVDSNRCIAYHTIENRGDKIPDFIASNLEGWVAGCDICQDVCPWNQRFAKESDVTDFQPYPWNLAPKLTDLATISHEEWNRRFPASALRRIKPEMLRRNALANLKNLEFTQKSG